MALASLAGEIELTRRRLHQEHKQGQHQRTRYCYRKRQLEPLTYLECKLHFHGYSHLVQPQQRCATAYEDGRALMATYVQRGIHAQT